ncbi:MAG: DNA polymerase III subunit beta [candidate division WOR-3 bacterium]|jgi:DNA polymerase III subunit beta
MLFSINAEDFVKEFKPIIQIVPVHTTFPVLSNVKIEVEKEKLNIFATDLDTSLLYSTNLCKTEQPGVIVIPAKTLFSVMGEIKGETIFRKEESRIKIEYDQGYFYLPLMEEEDFPSKPLINEEETYEVNVEELEEIIDKLVFIVPEDSSKRKMSGMLWEYEDQKLKLVATDSFSLGYKDITVNLGGKSFKIVVPPKILRQLSTFNTKKMKIGVDESRIYFLGEQFNLVSNLIKVDFPNYKAVISEKSDNMLTLNRETFLNSLKRVSVFSNDRPKTVNLNLGETLNVEVFSEIGESREELEGTYKGKEINIALSSNYLIDFLRKIKSKNVNLNFEDKNKPIIIEGEDKEIFYLLMPITIE